MGIGANIFGTADVGQASASAGGGVDANYGPAVDGTSAGRSSTFHPATGFGLGFWFGVGGVVALVLIRRSLPG